MSSSVRRELEGFVAGRVKPEQLVIAVAAAYYGERGNGKGERLRPLIEVIDRASPGIVELGSAPGGSGFEIRPVERGFPNEYEAELRRAAEAVLGRGEAGGAARGVAGEGAIARVLRAVRRLFNPSA